MLHCISAYKCGNNHSDNNFLLSKFELKDSVKYFRHKLYLVNICLKLYICITKLVF